MLIPSIDLKAARSFSSSRASASRSETRTSSAGCGDSQRFPKVQVIDLDAAMGDGDNLALVRQIAAALSCRVGGGIRTIDRARRCSPPAPRQIIVGSALFKDGRPDLAFARDAGRSGRRRTRHRRRRQPRRPGRRPRLEDGAAAHARSKLCARSSRTAASSSTPTSTREGLMEGTDLDAILAVRARDRPGASRPPAASRSREEIDELDARASTPSSAWLLYTGLLDQPLIRWVISP